MNKLVLYGSNKTEVVYEYYPDGGNECGIIKYTFSTNQAKLVRKAVGDETGYYGRKAMSKIEQVVKDEDALPMELIQAWH